MLANFLDYLIIYFALINVIPISLVKFVFGYGKEPVKEVSVGA